MRPLTNELQMMNGTEVFGDLPGRTNETKKFLSVASRRTDIRKLNIESKHQVCLYWLAMCDISVFIKPEALRQVKRLTVVFRVMAHPGLINVWQSFEETHWHRFCLL